MRFKDSFQHPDLSSTRTVRRQAWRKLRRLRGEHGAAIVETALCSVLVLTLIFGIMRICTAIYIFHFISDAAREASRYAMVRGSACSGFASACPASASDVQTYIRGLGFPGVDASEITVATTWPTTGSSCAPSSVPCNNPGNLVAVTVQYRFPLYIPFLPSRTLSMSSSSQMVISQ